VSADVVALPGTVLAPPAGQPVDGVVDLCRRLLADAEAGDLRGIALAFVHRDSARVHTTWAHSGEERNSAVLIAGVAVLQHELARNTRIDDVEERGR